MLKWPIMCGRFSRTQNEEELRERFGFEPSGLELEPRYNFAPGQDGTIVILDGVRKLRLMRWGLVPSWVKDEKAGYKAINARSETLVQKPMFKGLLKNKRCLVLADGFYEWQKTASGKKPMRYVLKDRAPFAFAGLWNCWQNANGQELYSFTIVTTRANELIKPVHERMPVMLKPEHEQVWLDLGLKDPEDLDDLLGPYPSELMEGYAVSPACNSPAREGPECVQPFLEKDGLFD